MKCKDGLQCIDAQDFCDGFSKDCNDGSDADEAFCTGPCNKQLRCFIKGRPLARKNIFLYFWKVEIGGGEI